MMLELEPRNFDQIIDVAKRFNQNITKDTLEGSYISSVMAGNVMVLIHGDDGYAFLRKELVQNHLNTLIAVIDAV